MSYVDRVETIRTEDVTARASVAYIRETIREDRREWLVGQNKIIVMRTWK